jgi:hypothetical protein
MKDKLGSFTVFTKKTPPTAVKRTAKKKTSPAASTP